MWRARRARWCPGIEARESGHRVFYAIADVATFVPPDSLVDQAAHERGMTLYSPDHRSPLHPTPLSEGTASLLPGVERPAVLWTLDVGSDGELEEVSVERARVMSRAQLTYEDAQRRHRKDTTVLQFREPPVIGPLPGQVGDLGQQLDVQVFSVGTDARTVDFAPV